MNTFRFTFLVLLFVTMPIRGFSYTNDQVVVFGDCYYKVVSEEKLTLSFLGTKPTKTGALTLSAKITDNEGYVLTVVGVEFNPLYKSVGITSVQLPETIEFIKMYAFRWAKLSTMNIPKKVKTIEPGAWIALFSTPKFTVDPSNSYFENDEDGALYTTGKRSLLSVPSNVPLKGGTYTVNSDVKYINAAAIQNIEGLTKIVLPKNLEGTYEGYPTIAPISTLVEMEIPSDAPHYKTIDGVLFRDTTLVVYPMAKADKNYTVPNGIKAITSYAISSSRFLESISLNEVTRLVGSAIYNAPKLTTITLPKKLKPFTYETGDGMMEGGFEACPNLTEYKVDPGNADFVAVNGVLFSKDMKTLYFYPAAKAGASYTIPSTVELIARQAFQGVKGITTMHIPAKVKNINAMAFRGMSNLERIIFDANSQLEDIQYYAFWSCNKLKEVTLPKSLLYLNEIFYVCTGLETINIPAGSKLRGIKIKAFATNTKLKAFNFLGDCDLEKIERNVFADLSNLQSFKIPKSVKTIESNAFIGCTNMKTVTFDPNADMVEIGAGAFADCGITSINVPKKVKKIEREAFLRCQALTTIDITKATTYISPEAFKYCSNLTAINVDKDNSVYSSVDGYLLSKSKNTLMIFPPGKANSKFTPLPPSITAIGEYAFYDCKKLENVTVPNKVMSIGKRAFGLCDNLNTITFLCDQIITPMNINQEQNEESFDVDKPGQKKMGKIKINVRKDKLSAYQSDPFYQKFASINSSFQAGTEEYIAVSENAVDLLSTTRNDHTFILPTEISNGSKKYEVSLIGDYAFENAPNSIKEVVVKQNVKYIGAKAFVKNNSKIQSVFFIESEPTKEMLGTTRFELDATGKNYNEFDPDTKIYVKKSAYDKYKAEWTKTVYNDTKKREGLSPFNFTSQIDYKIKDTQIETKYVTFAREFDVDFGDCASNGGVNVAAFVYGRLLNGSGDYGGNTPQHIRMKSIDQHGGVSDSYTYVPANTGVLLKILGSKNSTGGLLYYTIGEKDNVTYHITDNVMNGIEVKSKKVDASTTSPIYVLQKGVFKKATAPILNFPVHKAYLTLPSGAAPSKELKPCFDDDETTNIENATTSEEMKANDVYYNLNGQRVSNPQKGVYVHNGRKVLVK